MRAAGLARPEFAMPPASRRREEKNQSAHPPRTATDTTSVSTGRVLKMSSMGGARFCDLEQAA